MGSYFPDERLVIIVPYRNREAHLLSFIPYMEQFLFSVPHQFLVIEQADDQPFNKGRLLNAAFTLIRHKTSCVCFHDVDMLPLDDARHYTIPKRTTHIAGCIEQYGYQLPYPEYVGGVFLTPVDEFSAINGFSNEYWGWGGEDDEIFARLHLASLAIERRPGRYRSLPHERSEHSIPNNSRLMQTLAELAQHTSDEGHLARIAEIQDSYRKMFDIQMRDPSDFRKDGLSSITYRELVRTPLKEAFSFAVDIPDSYELIRVTL